MVSEQLDRLHKLINYLELREINPQLQKQQQDVIWLQGENSRLRNELKQIIRVHELAMSELFELKEAVDVALEKLKWPF